MSNIEYLKTTPFYDEANPPKPTGNPHFFRKEKEQPLSGQEKAFNEQIKSRLPSQKKLKLKIDQPF